VAGMTAGVLVVLCFTPVPALLLGSHLPESFTDATGWLKRLFDLGFIGFVVNTVVFVVVSRFTRPLPLEHRQEFARLMAPEGE